MRYEGTVYRPPSEARSLVLQATVGCSYNRCTYCAMYQDKRFRPRTRAELREDMALVPKPESVRRVFLADGDALVLRTERLLEILADLKKSFPRFERAGVYASPQSLLAKSVEDLTRLKAAGLRIYYLGPESGHPAVLENIRKGVTPAELIEGGRKVVRAGAKLSVILLLGVGGADLSEEHAVASAELVNAIEPRYVSTLTLVPVPGTPLHDQVARGELVLPSPRGMLAELRTLLAHLDLPGGALFRSNHVSNSLPLGGTLNRDKQRLLAVLDQVLADGSLPLRPPPDPSRL